MKTILTSLTALILFNNSLAQVSSSEPIQLNKNILVHSAGLPEEFLLFSPDSATQILFNPARAYNYITNFVYVNYLSDYVNSYPYRLEFPSLYEEIYSSSKNPTFSAAALFNAGDAKWLVTLANGINLRKDEYNIVHNVERIYDPINNFSRENEETRSNTDSDEMVTTLKISRIWESGLTNLSLGAFGIIYTNNENGKGDFISELYNFYNSTNDSTKRRQLLLRQESGIRKVNDTRYAFGLEFAINNEKLDYVGSISYQKANNSGNISDDYNSTVYDSLYDSYPWQTHGYEGRITNVDRLENEPYFLSFNNYFEHTVDWITSNDNLFITLNSFYSNGEISYSNNYNEVVNYFNNGIVTDSDTSFINQNGSTDAKNWGVAISSGYALSASLSDLFILTGFKLSGSFSRLENVRGGLSSHPANLFSKNITKDTFAGFTFPLYLNYTIEKWVSIHGGINYSYFYWRRNDELSYEALNYMSYLSNFDVEASVENEASGWISSKSIYLGCELRHSSGLKVQFFFDEDFSNIRDFNVSVGYHF